MEDRAAHDLLERLKSIGDANGGVGLGVCSVEPFVEVQAEMDRRLESGEAGRRRFTYTDPVISTDVRTTFRWSERLLVAAVSYLPTAGRPGPRSPNTGRIARFATSDQYVPLRELLAALSAELESAGFRAEPLADDNRLVDRAAAVRAGVAWWGKSTMALAPGFGPWMLLGSVVTDAPLPVSEPMVRDCGTCTACIPACPTGALDTEGVLDATRCISYWAQTPGMIPLAIREAWGDRLYGCDDCLEACPPGERWEADATTVAGRVDLLELLNRSDAELLAEYGHFYIPRRDPRFLRRNALVALGQSGTTWAEPVITGYLQSPVAVLRAHAAWALGSLGAAGAIPSLRQAAAVESDSLVKGEFVAALERLADPDRPVR
ncbi:MAG: HEAT repeat domain-containing protein [Acidimicrobiia bacterium]|nr:HEAT repeat domain-containing protein [Acidimicrobiia bacterium]MBT8193475.1 HEAT repeat domain-containing protein [Acidimicrobiia bacterium]